MAERKFITSANLLRFGGNVKKAISNAEDAVTQKASKAQETADNAVSLANTAQQTANSKLSSVKTINGKSIVGTGNLTLSDIGIDGNICEIVTKLPDLASAKSNKMYLVPVVNSEEDSNTYAEYVMITVDGTAKWEKLGEWNPKIKLDTEMSATSTNPVQNKVIFNEIQGVYGQLETYHDDTNDQLSGKVDKVSGKQLSTNDYTTAEKTKLSGIADGATKVIVDSAFSSTSTNPVQNKLVNERMETLNTKIETETGKCVKTADLVELSDDDIDTLWANA